MLPIRYRKGCHPQIKKHFDFSNDRYSWYWIYFRGYIFNTYEWYIASKGKYYVVWKNMYCIGEKDEPVVKVKLSKIKKVVCWKVGEYHHMAEWFWNLPEEDKND